MERRDFLKAVGATATTLGLNGSSYSWDKEKKNIPVNNMPNVLFICVDQLRYDTLGCNGNQICQTPHLDKLAAEGVRFTRAYTPCSLCSPARASIFTGRYAFSHGMGTNCDLYHSLAAELTHPEMLLHTKLLDAGYRCGFQGKWHVGTKLGPCDYGFEGMNLGGYGNIRKDAGYIEYLASNSLTVDSVKQPIYTNPNNQTLCAGIWGGSTQSTPAYYLTEKTIEMLGDYSQTDQPFFLTCQFWGPHMPCLPTPEYYGRHDRADIKPWPNFRDDFTNKPDRLKRERRDFYRALPENWDGWQEIVGCYYDFMTMIDDQIGRILQKLDELQLSQNTVVIFTTDHGDMTGSHGGLFDKGFMYEEAHHIPLIFRYPDHISANISNDELVMNMDIMPTVFDLAGIPHDPLDAVSLVPYLKNKLDTILRDCVYLEFHGLRSLYSQRAMITRDGWKYIFTPGDEDEVYNLNSDPAELNNLIFDDSESKTVEKLRRKLLKAAVGFSDPIQDYISKLFGNWEKLSGNYVKNWDRLDK